MMNDVFSRAACDRHAARLTSLGCLLAMLVGCAERGPERIPVSGSVTIDGRPIEDATIIFTPQSSGLAAAAMIENGRFSMSEIDGPTVGEHIIRINPNEGEMEDVVSSDTPQPDSRLRIPKIYQLPGELRATVTDDPQQELRFELKSPARG